MKSLDSANKKQGADLSDEEELDLELAVKTAKKLVAEGGGFKVIQDALETSQDPAAVLGPFFAQLFVKMQEAFPADLEVSPRVYLCKGGVLEQLLDFMEKQLGLPKEFSDEVWDSTLETIKASAQEPPAGEAPVEQGAPAPEQAMPAMPGPQPDPLQRGGM